MKLYYIHYDENHNGDFKYLMRIAEEDIDSMINIIRRVTGYFSIYTTDNIDPNRECEYTSGDEYFTITNKCGRGIIANYKIKYDIDKLTIWEKMN